MKKTLMTLFLFLAIFTLGCQSAGPKTMDEQLQYLKAISEFARDNDMALSVQVTFSGRAGIFQEAALGVDTGVQIQATVIANAGDADKTPDGD